MDLVQIFGKIQCTKLLKQPVIVRVLTVIERKECAPLTQGSEAGLDGQSGAPVQRLAVVE